MQTRAEAVVAFKASEKMCGALGADFVVSLEGNSQNVMFYSCIFIA